MKKLLNNILGFLNNKLVYLLIIATYTLLLFVHSICSLSAAFTFAELVELVVVLFILGMLIYSYAKKDDELFKTFMLITFGRFLVTNGVKILYSVDLASEIVNIINTYNSPYYYGVYAAKLIFDFIAGIGLSVLVVTILLKFIGIKNEVLKFVKIGALFTSLAAFSISLIIYFFAGDFVDFAGVVSCLGTIVFPFVFLPLLDLDPFEIKEEEKKEPIEVEVNEDEEIVMEEVPFEVVEEEVEEVKEEPVEVEVVVEAEPPVEEAPSESVKKPSKPRKTRKTKTSK